MEVRDELALVGEIGISFAGFLSIFPVFASRDGRFSPGNSLQVLTVVATGFGLVFSALVPFVLHHLGVQPHLLWRLSGGIALCSAIPVSLYTIRRDLALPSEDRAKGMHALSRVVGLGLGLVNFAIFAALVLGVAGPGAPGIYLFALVLGLAIGAWNFVALTLTRLL